MDTDTDNAPCSFRPTINRRSRRLTSGLLSVQERQQFDLTRRERRHKELIAKVEAERQLTETFTPATNRHARYRRSSIMGSGEILPASVKTTCIGNPEETFRPVINIKSERMMANGALQNNQKHTQQIRQRVQGLWRQFADSGSGEITLSGVHCVLRGLGLNAPSPMVDKFLLALGINESLGIRCVPYDRFMKVFTVVLRAALVSPPPGECGDSNSNDNNIGEHSVLGPSDSKYLPRQSSIRSYDSVPTMRRANSASSFTHERSGVRNSRTRTKTSIFESQQSGDFQDTDLSGSHYRQHVHDYYSKDEMNNENNSSSDDEGSSPLPAAPPEIMQCQENKDSSIKTCEGSQGPSSSIHQQDSGRQSRKPTYNPLNECTFVPTINKKYRPLASSKHRSGGEGESTSRKTSILVYKTKEEKEMEECTFAPNTASYHKNRESLAWWTKEPCVETNNETTSPDGVGGNEVYARFVSPRGKMGDQGAKPHDPAQITLQMPKKQPEQSPLTKTRTQQQQERRPGASSARIIPIAMGFDKTVKRMIEARRSSRPKFEEMLRTSGGEAQRQLKLTVVQPFRLHAQVRHLEREQQKPLLFVDVDLPSGKTGRIGVYRGDTAADLAKGFSQAYQLGDELRERLECVLSEKLNELLRENVQTLWL